MRETLGTLLGAVMAPAVAAVSALRHARMFHPEGVVYAAAVTPAASGDLLHAGERLAGRAIVRLSSALWRGGKEWIDALGIAIRFEGDQDLLAATIRFPWTTPIAPLATDVHSFLWNHYHAVSPFELAGVGRIKLRLKSPRIVNDRGLSRSAHLANMVSAGRAAWILEARRLSEPWFLRQWEPLARLELLAPLAIDQEALRFSPFHTGRGLRPVGFVHRLRAATYAASQRARPAVE